MRIIAGKYKGKKLISPINNIFRPSGDRLKETLFNIIEFHFKENIINKNFLDIFSGSGAIGIEALSRGSTNSTLIENNNTAVDIIKKNIPKKSVDNFTLISKDFFKAKYKDFSHLYSMVYIDPPYHKNLYEKTLFYLLKLQILESNSIIITESLSSENINISLLDNIELLMQKIIGNNMLSFYKLII